MSQITSSTIPSTQTLTNSVTSETTYRRLELFLIGFASIFITLLWVGVFSTVLQNNHIRFAFLGEGQVASGLRSAAGLLQSAALGAIEAGSLAKDTIAYQFVAIYESSCLTQGTCTGGLSLATRGVGEVAQTASGMANHSHRVVAIAEGLFAGRMIESGNMMLSLLTNQKAYAADVLGAQTVPTGELLNTAKTQYFSYIDAMTFGAISAMQPGLLTQ